MTYRVRPGEQPRFRTREPRRLLLAHRVDREVRAREGGRGPRPDVGGGADRTPGLVAPPPQAAVAELDETAVVDPTREHRGDRAVLGRAVVPLRAGAQGERA